MIEYLIRRTDGEWFDLTPDGYDLALQPSSVPCRRVEGRGDYRIDVDGVEISFSCEDPGIQVSFEGEMPEALAGRIAGEILANIIRVTGQQGKIVQIS